MRAFLSIAAPLAVGAALELPVCSQVHTDYAGASWDRSVRIYEYVSNANPTMTEVPVRVYPPSMHQRGPSAIMPFDLSSELEVDYPATSPNLLANFVRVLENETLETGVAFAATSQTFYVIRGRGSSLTRNGTVEWAAGDMFVLPYFGDDVEPVCTTSAAGAQCVVHTCAAEPEYGGCALYWVHDEPLLQYLGVEPSSRRRFDPAFYTSVAMKATVQSLSNPDADGEVKNRRGILLGNSATSQTRTLTPTLWSLLNTIGPKMNQKPHKHNSVALDLAVYAAEGAPVYTRMSRELDGEGALVNPMMAKWETGGVFVTPPGWWHSHHNEGDEDAWVMPVQDAGIYTHQRTLDFRFADEEVARLQAGRARGATIDLATTRTSENLYRGTPAECGAR
jgi:gentisate 1,2-dioxygenase